MRFGGRKTPKEKKEGRQRQQRVISCSSASDSNDGSGRCFSDDKFSGCRIEIREGVPQYFLNLPFHFGFRRRPQAHCLACDLEAIVRELWAHFVSSGCCCRIYHSWHKPSCVDSVKFGYNLQLRIRGFKQCT